MHESGLTVPDYIGIDEQRRPVRHANEFWDHYGVHVHDETREPGDLIFFTRQGMFPTHIGIVRDEESFIHSPGKDNHKVEVASIEESEVVSKRNLGRAVFTRNPIGFKAHTTLIDDPSYRHFQEVI